MTDPQQVAWNRGKVAGNRSPLTFSEVSLIRLLLRQDSRTQPATVRDLALFNVALDT